MRCIWTFIYSWQTFQAIAQSHCLSAKPKFQSLCHISNIIICVHTVVFICYCKKFFQYSISQHALLILQQWCVPSTYPHTHAPYISPVSPKLNFCLLNKHMWENWNLKQLYKITFIKMTIKHNNSLNLITGCLYISFFGLHVSAILMTIIRSVRAKEIAMQHRCMAISLVLTDLMMVVRMTETCSPKKLI